MFDFDLASLSVDMSLILSHVEDVAVMAAALWAAGMVVGMVQRLLGVKRSNKDEDDE